MRRGGSAPRPASRAKPADPKAKAGGTAATGVEGEALAAEFLVAHGYEVVVRNWRNPHDRREELDLVCRDGVALVFVEVKARDDAALVPGYYTVDFRKKKVLLSACRAYLRSLRVRPDTFRFDVVEVTTHFGAPSTVLHFENIPLFDKHWVP